MSFLSKPVALGNTAAVPAFCPHQLCLPLIPEALLGFFPKVLAFVLPSKIHVSFISMYVSVRAAVCMTTCECGVKNIHELIVTQRDLTLAHIHSLKGRSPGSQAERGQTCRIMVGIWGECHLLARVCICVCMHIAHVYAKVCALCMHVGLCALVGTCPGHVSVYVCVHGVGVFSFFGCGQPSWLNLCTV